MDAVGAFAALAIVIATGFFGQLIFKKTHVPDVIFLIALGIVIGPQVLGFVDDSMMSNLASAQGILMALALVFILFEGGLGLRFKAVLENMGIAIFQTLIAFVLSLFAVSILGFFFLGLTSTEALLLGGIVGGTSGAVVLAIVPHMNIKEDTRTLLSLESALTDVIVIVFVVVLVQMITRQTAGFGDVGWIILASFGISGAIGIIAGILWLELLKMFEDIPFSYMLTLAVLFAIFAICESPVLGGSGAIAALFFGLVMGNKKHFETVFKRVKIDFALDEQIKYLNSEITFFLRSFFFVYLGLIFSLNIATFWFFSACAIICAGILMARFVAAKLTAFVGDLDTSDEKGIFAMLPRGLAAAVLATYPLQQGVVFTTKENNPFIEDTASFMQNAVLVIILATTILATILTFISERHAAREFERRQNSEDKEELSAAEEVYLELTESRRYK